MTEKTNRVLTREECELLDEYSEWSEDTWCAGFIHPDEAMVRRFMEHKFFPPPKPVGGLMRGAHPEAYEIEMLEKYRALLPEFEERLKGDRQQ